MFNYFFFLSHIAIVFVVVVHFPLCDIWLVIEIKKKKEMYSGFIFEMKKKTARFTNNNKYTRQKKKKN